MNRKKIKQEIKIKTNYLLTNLNKMSMKKVYLFLAAVAGMTITSCTTNDYLGDVNNEQAINDGSIQFGLGFQNMTRANIAGSDAAKKLGNHFYVAGTKGTEQTTSPSTTAVFDNYLVSYEANSAGTSESNTANWEYVGVTPDGTNYAKLSPASVTAQTVKYWDYSQTRYDFLAFSTGSYKAVNKTNLSGEGDNQIGADEIGVTAMKYGSGLAGATAYTFYVPSADAIENAYITDITPVLKANYGNDVQLTFKNLGAKIRIGLYETVPGYSVKNVVFYTVDGTNDFTDANKGATATLLSADDTNGFVTKGTIAVMFPSIGTEGSSKADYNKASVTVTPVNPASPAAAVIKKEFGSLNYTGKETSEADGNYYLGRTLPNATFAGAVAKDYYQVVFPVSSSSAALTLRVDYTLVSTDGSNEEIKVYGAKAVVPATYTVWQPNYAYTYIFKISDNTNGWTDPTGAEPAGLFPITFDAVVAEAKETSGQQTTVTTVATPSITTYQQGHTKANNEYSKTQKAGADTENTKALYVQVMNNSTADPTLVTTLAADKSNSLIYLLSDDATEAKVMDALQMRTTEVGTVASANVKGRNGLELTNAAANIDNTVTQIVNGADDKPKTVDGGSAAKINISALTAGKSYAYVYIPTAKTKEINQFEYVPITVGQKINGSDTEHVYYTLTVGQVAAGETLAAAEDPNTVANEAYVYFSVTKDASNNDVYSYISPLGKGSIPAGCKKVAKTTITGNATATGNDNAVANTFYFDKYITNDAKYAVKVFKVLP